MTETMNNDWQVRLYRGLRTRITFIQLLNWGFRPVNKWSMGWMQNLLKKLVRFILLSVVKSCSWRPSVVCTSKQMLAPQHVHLSRMPVYFISQWLAINIRSSLPASLFPDIENKLLAAVQRFTILPSDHKNKKTSHKWFQRIAAYIFL